MTGEITRLTPLDPQNKSGHYVGATDQPCWCGDIHYYGKPGACPNCGTVGACASILCAPQVTC